MTDEISPSAPTQDEPTGLIGGYGAALGRYLFAEVPLFPPIRLGMLVVRGQPLHDFHFRDFGCQVQP
jgi:hypothetical protein